MLIRDRALLKRRIITHGVLVHFDEPEVQTLEVIRRLDLTERLAPFSRCLQCNGELIGVAKEEVVDRLEPLTRRYYTNFSWCGGTAAGSTGAGHTMHGWSNSSNGSAAG